MLQLMFPGKYIEKEEFKLHKIHNKPVGFLNQNVVEPKLCNVPK